MSENATNPSERPYDPEKDADADPEMMEERRPAAQGENTRDQAEGAEDEAPGNS